MCGAIQSTTPLDSYAAAGAKHVCRPYFQFQHSDQRKRRLQSDLEKLMQNVASSEHYVQIIDSFSKIYHEQKSGRESELGFLKELEDIVTKTSEIRQTQGTRVSSVIWLLGKPCLMNTASSD